MRILDWLVKVCQYAILLWHDYDHSPCSILRLLEYKLSRVRKCNEEDMVHCQKGVKRNIKRIRTCELLLKRLQDDDYWVHAYRYVNSKWGIDGSDIDSINFGMSLPPKEHDQYRRDRLESFRIEEVRRNQDLDLFYKLFKSNYRGWWV